jgi:CheY-like chemotaxis protein
MTNVLIIDDNQSITTMLSRFLELKGHSCSISNTSRNGLALLEKQRFDVVLLDLSMPEFTGFDVIDTLVEKKLIEDQNIIVCTAKSLQPSEIETLLKKGVKACLEKPMKLTELLAIINSYSKMN